MNAKNRFWRIVRIVARDSRIAVGDAVQAAADEHDVAGLLGDVGAGADRDAQVGLRQGRGVVDAVADHRDDGATPCACELQLAITSALPPGLRRRGRRRCRPACAIAVAAAALSPVSRTVRRPSCVQLRDGGGGVGLELVGQAR